MQKCREILSFLDALTLRGVRYIIADHWQADLTAIGIAKPGDRTRLAYVASKNDGFFVELERAPSADEAGMYSVENSFDGLTKEEAFDVIRRHLTS